MVDRYGWTSKRINYHTNLLVNAVDCVLCGNVQALVGVPAHQERRSARHGMRPSGGTVTAYGNTEPLAGQAPWEPKVNPRRDPTAAASQGTLSPGTSGARAATGSLTG